MSDDNALLCVRLDIAAGPLRCPACGHLIIAGERFSHRPTRPLESLTWLVECVRCAFLRLGVTVIENDTTTPTTIDEVLASETISDEAAEHCALMAREQRWADGARNDRVKRESDGHPF